MASKALYMMRLFVEACIVVMLSFFLWAWMIAKPLDIQATIVVERTAAVYAPGDTLLIKNVSRKEQWAVEFCTATMSIVNFQDSRGFVGQYFENRLNYNDGTITLHPSEVPIPNGLAPGAVKVYKTVTYSCWGGWMNYTAITPTNGWGNFLLGEIR